MEDFRRVSHFLLFIYDGRADFFRYSVGGKPHCFVQYLTVTVCTGASAVKGREMTLLDDLRLFETDAYVIHLPVPGRSWLTVFNFHLHFTRVTNVKDAQRCREIIPASWDTYL